MTDNRLKSIADQITETAAGDRLGEESPATEGPGSSLSAGPSVWTPTDLGGIEHASEVVVTSDNDRPETQLEALIKSAGERFAALSPEQQEAELQAQKASFVRGEVGMGTDADEAEYRRRLLAGEPLFDTPNGAPPKDEAGAVGAKPRVASDNDGPELPAGPRRVRA